MRTLLYPFVRRNPFYMRGGTLDKILPPNPEQVIQWLGESYVAPNGKTYLEDKSVEGGDVTTVKSVGEFFGDVSGVYINTNIIPKNNTRIVAEILNLESWDGSTIACFSGSRDAWMDGSMFYFGIRDAGANIYLYSGAVSTAATHPYEPTGLYETWDVSMDGGLKFNGKHLIDPNDTFTGSSSPIYIGGLNRVDSGQYNIPLDALYKSYKVYEGDELILNLDFTEGNGSNVINTVTGELIPIQGDLTNFWQTLTLDTPELVPDSSVWTDGSNEYFYPYNYYTHLPIFPQGSTPPTAGLTWVREEVNSVTKGYNLIDGTLTKSVGISDGVGIHIDTGIVPNNKIKIEVGCKVNIIINNAKVFGCRDNSADFFFFGIRSTGYWYGACSLTTSNITSFTNLVDTDYHVHNFDAKSGLYCMDGDVMGSFIADEIDSTQSIYLFSENILGADNLFDGSLRYCKIWQDDVLVFNADFTTSNGSNAINTVDGSVLPIQNYTPAFWGSTDLGKPEIKKSASVWTNGTDEYHYPYYYDTNTPIFPQGSTPPTAGLTWVREEVYDLDGVEFYNDRYDAMVSGSNVGYFDGASNVIDEITTLGQTEHPHIKCKIVNFSGNDEWYVNRRSDATLNREFQLYTLSGIVRCTFYYNGTQSSAVSSSYVPSTGECLDIEMYYDGDNIVLNVNGTINTLNIGAVAINKNSTSLTIGRAGWDSIFYLSSSVSFVWLGDYVLGTELASIPFSNGAGTYVYDTVNNTPLFINGDTTNFWQTSEYAEDLNRKNGFSTGYTELPLPVTLDKLENVTQLGGNDFYIGDGSVFGYLQYKNLGLEATKKYRLTFETYGVTTPITNKNAVSLQNFTPLITFVDDAGEPLCDNGIHVLEVTGHTSGDTFLQRQSNGVGEIYVRNILFEEMELDSSIMYPASTTNPKQDIFGNELTNPGTKEGLNGSENGIIQHPDLLEAGGVFELNPWTGVDILSDNDFHVQNNTETSISSGNKDLFKLEVTSIGTASTNPFVRNYGELWVVGETYRVSFNYKVISGVCNLSGFYFGSFMGEYKQLVGEGSFVGEYIPTADYSASLAIYFDGRSLFSVELSDVKVERLSQPKEVQWEDIVYDYESAKLWLNGINGTIKKNWTFYSVPQQGDDWNNLLKFNNMLDERWIDVNGEVITEAVTGEWIIDPTL